MTGRGLLIDELRWICRNCADLFKLLKPEQMDFRAHPDIRSVFELTNYLAQVPSVDLRIVRGDDEEKIRALEQELSRDNPAGWSEVLREGMEETTRYYEKQSLDEFENGSAMAYYGRTQTHARWLIETISRMYHHRSQLIFAMKLSGSEVRTDSVGF